MGFARLIKRLFGQYEEGYEYWVHTRDIKIKPSFRRTRIGENKFRRKIAYWYENGEFESKIILDKNFVLVDGYSSFRIAESNGVEKVPVYFVD